MSPCSAGVGIANSLLAKRSTIFERRKGICDIYANLNDRAVDGKQ